MSDSSREKESLPVAIIGAGPVGLAAAAELVQRGMQVQVFEQGGSAGWALREWGQVRFFSPWKYLLGKAARQILEQGGWQAPDSEGLPTASEFVESYLTPLAESKALSASISYGRRVLAVSRRGMGRIQSEQRFETPFQINWEQDGKTGQSLARAVIDGSGTWFNPNALGANGLPVPGERFAGIRYGIPDILGEELERYAGKSVLLVGSGHSAMQSALNLLNIKNRYPETRIVWAHRRKSIAQLASASEPDFLGAREELGRSVRAAISVGDIDIRYAFSIQRIETGKDKLVIAADQDGVPVELEVDQIVSATGFRPELSLFSELRTELDPILEAPSKLAPLIDPNIHSCGTVPPHGVAQLRHPERDFYIAGAKAYGRAPNFLMLTGYEQVRSIAAEIAGDVVGANTIELVLPASGACGVGAAEGSSCCGGAPASSAASACCKKDEVAKEAGLVGCGC